MLLAIAGPTGVGKSDVAAAIARRIPSEIVVVDSMQVYRGMDVGTSKPPASVRQEIPHHGLDLADPEEEFDVARYVRSVRPCLEEIRGRGRLPLLVGGSGLYLRALLDGLCEAPGGNALLREELLEEGARAGSEKLHARLQAVDPEAGARIHPNDLRRIVRALEVFLATSKPMTVWQKETPRPFDPASGIRMIGLTADRDWLYRRVEERVDRWLDGGWLEEARRLSARPLSRTARAALGYEELFDFLEGRLDWPETRRRIQQRTRRYARRQWAWFRQDRRIVWVQAGPRPAEELAERILSSA